MTTIQLKDIKLSTEMLDANQISSTFVHKDGTQDIGEINLSGNYIGNNGKIETNIKEVLPSGSIAINGICRTNDSIAIGCKDGNMKNCAIADASLCCETGKEARGNAFAFGYNAKALNYCACAIGSGEAIGEYAFVACGGKATSTQSFATGGLASGDHSVAEGYSKEARGAASHVEGNQTFATGGSSHAEGNKTQALQYAAHAEGDYSIANGESSHAEGLSTYTSANATHSEGYCTSATYNYSHAEGASTLADATATHSEGYITKTFANYSHVEGYNNTLGISGDVGRNGIASHVEGYNNVVYSDYSHCEGAFNTISGQYSQYCHADGVSVSILSAENTYAWNGDYTTPYEVSSWGTYNINPKNGLKGFYIGNINFLSCITEAIKQIATDPTAKAALKTELNKVLA